MSDALSDRAAAVLDRLRHPQTEDGWQTWSMLGVKITGDTAQSIKRELSDEGFVIESKTGKGLRLVESREVNHCGERPAEPPIRIEIPSCVIGSGAAPSPLPPAPLPRDVTTAPAPAPPPAPAPFAGYIPDPEVDAIADCVSAIDRLDPDGRHRVVMYLAQRYV